ncbi:MAG: VWA domain-containing protein [Thermodesulfobacteriota bacterium]|nr:VWA domain-containing protein [Thermodesulfobacteriota bacterium]
MLQRLKKISMALSLLIMLPASALCEEKSLLFYILDGSGSMWGRVDGRLKIQVAKEVMTRLINETPVDIPGGIMVYGHRKKGDCSDIEIIVPIGALDKKAAIAEIKRITPKGKTPISNSISMAIEKIKAAEYASTIVLVSDGIETCGKDPCSVTKKLKESGINFVIHVVGFGVKGVVEEQLSCIARKGGGKYFSTSNATELLSALNQIKESVAAKKKLVSRPAKPQPTPESRPVKQQVSKSSTSIRIKAKGPGTVSLKRDSWLKPPYYWKLIDPETGEEKARFRGLGDQLVPPGEYQVVWRQTEHGGGEVTLGEVISVESRKTTAVILKTGILPVTPTWAKTPRFWELKDATTKKVLAHFQSLETQLVPSGEYDLVWRQSEHGSSTLTLARVTILPDKVNEVRLSTALNLVPADWLTKKLRFWELQDIESSRPIARFRMGFAPQLVPHGKYRLIYRKSEHSSNNSYLGDVTIKEGEMNEFPINTGIVLVPQPGIKPPYRIEFIELSGKGKKVRSVFLRGSFDPMPLKPGKYKITYRQTEHGSSTITLIESFDLPAGNLVEVEL